MKLVKVKFVTDIKVRFTHYSTIALMIGVSSCALWVAFPSDLKARLSPQTLDYIAYGLLAVMIFGTVGKFIQQPIKPPEVKNDPAH